MIKRSCALQILRNESGMGILQMLILAGISAAMLAAISAAVVNMFKSQNTVAQSLDARLFNEQLTQVLSNDAICTSVFTGTILPVPAATEVPIARSVEFASGTKNLGAGNPIDENLEVKEASLRYDPVHGISDIVQGAVSYRVARATFKIQLRKRSSNTFVREMRPLEVNMFADLGASNEVLACSAFTSGSLACVAGGGIWNPASPTGMKCIPQKYCQYAGSFSDAPSSDGGFVNPLTGANSCPPGFDQQISGMINKASASGKYSVNNTPYRIYTCMSCGTALKPQTAVPFTPGAAMPMTDINDEAYQAVAAADDNNAGIAEADTALAKKAWDDGLAKSAQYQANINNAYAAISSAQASVNNANSNLNWAANDSSSASASLAAAQALDPADPGAVASAQSWVDSANSSYSYYANELSSAQSNLTSTTNSQNAVISSNTTAKAAQDLQNPLLEKQYRQYKAVSDYLRIVAKCSDTKAKAHQDPSMAPDSCDAIPACPSVAPFGTVVTPYGSC